MRHWKLSPLVLLFGMVCAAHASSVDAIQASDMLSADPGAAAHVSRPSPIGAGFIYEGINSGKPSQNCLANCKLDVERGRSLNALPDIAISPVPEPTTLLTMGAGLLAIFLGGISGHHSHS